MKKHIITLFLIFLTGCGTVSQKSNFTYSYPKEIIQIESNLTENDKNEIVMFSMNLLDTKYNWGGKKPNFGLDCSGLVSYVFKNSVNVKLTGAAKDIVNYGRRVPIHHAHSKSLELGDLLFFNTTGTPYSHIGIHIGNNSFLHASSGKGKVIISNLSNNYYLTRLEEIKRI